MVVMSVKPRTLGVDELAVRLRAHRPAVIARIAQGCLVFDMRTLADDEVDEIACALEQVLP